MLIDTHCHLNFQAFDDRVEEVIDNAVRVGVTKFIVPGTDIESSKKAVDLAEKFEGVYAAVGVHPHHVFQIYNKSEILNPKSQTNSKRLNLKNLNLSIVSDLVIRISNLLSSTKVVAIGEVGIDRHIYNKTKYKDYKIGEDFVDLQIKFFIEQIKLASQYKKALVMHNREAKKDILETLTANLSLITPYFAVFHCCEPDVELLEFAKKHKIFIGVDGDAYYWKEKQKFIKEVPLDLLVLETDSPFLSPDKKFPNEPKNIKKIAEFIADLKKIPAKTITEITTKNAKKLFNF